MASDFSYLLNSWRLEDWLGSEMCFVLNVLAATIFVIALYLDIRIFLGWLSARRKQAEITELEKN